MRKMILIIIALITGWMILFNLVSGAEDKKEPQPVHILAGIDSLTNGRLYSETPNRYLNDFIPALKKSYGDGGPGYIPFDTRFFNQEGGKLIFSTHLKEINNVPHDVSPAIYSFDFKGLYTNNGHSDQITIHLQNSWETVKVFYLKQPGGGTFRIGYLNGKKVKIDTNGYTGFGVVVLPHHKKGQSLVIRNIQGKVVLFGGYFYNPTGIVVSRVGQGGDQLAWYGGIDQKLLNEWVQALQPDLFIFNGGMNDRNHLTADQYEQALIRYLTPFREADCAMILTIPNAIHGNNTRLNEFTGKLRTYALNHHTGLVSNKEVLGETFQEAQNRGLMSDAIHPNAKGSELISRHFLTYIERHAEYQKIFLKK